MVDWPGEKSLIRLWETAERVCTGLLAPWQIKRTGKAHAEVRAYEARLDAQTSRDVERIREGFLPISADALPAPDQLTAHRIEPLPPSLSYDAVRVSDFVRDRERVEGTRKYLNIRNVVRFAEEEVLSRPEHTSEPATEEKPHVDWLHRWREGAEAVSDEDIQRLWARVLVGESDKPGSFSLWTLSTLRSLSRADAMLFQRAAAIVLNGNLITRGEVVLAQRGLDYGNLLRLQEMGLIAGIDTVGLRREMRMGTTPNGLNTVAISYHNQRAIIVQHGEKRTWEHPMIPLTLVGQEIYRLGAYEVDEAYLREIALWIKSHGYEAALADWRQLSEGEGNARNIEKL